MSKITPTSPKGYRSVNGDVASRIVREQQRGSVIPQIPDMSSQSVKSGVELSSRAGRQSGMQLMTSGSVYFKYGA